jgi:uncharacterized protein
VSGISGFAMGLVVSGVWLHMITPGQNALLIVLCGLVTHGSGICRVRHAGAYTLETMKLYALALPALIVGIWRGLKLYDKHR